MSTLDQDRDSHQICNGKYTIIIDNTEDETKIDVSAPPTAACPPAVLTSQHLGLTNSDAMHASDDGLLSGEPNNDMNLQVHTGGSFCAHQVDLLASDGLKSAATTPTLGRRRTITHSILNSASHYLASTRNSIAQIRANTMSISMLAKPSDDRKAHALLAGWNVSNLIQGTGILGVPYAVQQGGWGGVVAIFVVAILCCHTGKLLIDCMYETSKKTGIKRRLRINYPEVGEAVWKRYGYSIVSVVQFLEMFGASVMYLVLLGTVWKDMLSSIKFLGMPEWAALNALVTLPSLFITKMSIVSWLSLISVFSLISSIVVLIVFCFLQIPLWNIDNIPPFNAETFPVGFGIIVFSYCAHAVFPSIEGSMKNPQAFGKMMNYSFLLAALTKAAMGTSMVLTFGRHTQQVATVNLSSHPAWSQAATILVISNVILAVPLAMFIVSVSFDETFLKHFPLLKQETKYHWIWLLITRPLVLGFALLVAVVVPHFGLLMGLIGSFTGTCLCFLFPCYFHMKLRWTELKWYQIAYEILIILFGLVAGSLGLYFSAYRLVITLITGIED